MWNDWDADFIQVDHFYVTISFVKRFRNYFKGRHSRIECQLSLFEFFV